jgi:hypothetical protein
MGFYPENPNFGQKLQGALSSCPPIDKGFIAHYSASPLASSATKIHAGVILQASGQTLPGTAVGVTQPDVPRVLSIKGNQAGIVGDVVIIGQDAAGNAITDTIAANGSNVVAGAKAFKSVSSFAFPAKTGEGDEIAVGTTDKLGLVHKLKHNTVLLGCFDNSVETVTVSVSATDLSKNLIDMNSALASKVVDVYYIV